MAGRKFTVTGRFDQKKLDRMFVAIDSGLPMRVIKERFGVSGQFISDRKKERAQNGDRAKPS